MLNCLKLQLSSYNCVNDQFSIKEQILLMNSYILMTQIFNTPIRTHNKTTNKSTCPQVLEITITEVIIISFEETETQ